MWTCDSRSPVTYNLEQLGPTGFQDLAATLALTVFGPNVQALGVGRDGGRDMVHTGRVVWSGTDDEPGEVWDGYTVFQVKHKHALSSRPSDNAAWLREQIGKELERWADPSGDRNPMPDYMVVVSNVPLSPFPGSGGYDALRADIEQFIARFEDSSRDPDSKAALLREEKLARLRKIRAWQFWDGNQLDALLDEHDSVRHAFPAFLTAADVFANLSQFTNNLNLDVLEPALRIHARAALTGEGLIYFDEAGGSEATGFPVHELATDLPVAVADGTKRQSAIGYVLDRAEHMLKPRVTLTARPRHLVVTGAPGNGKTTLSKLLVQVFRAAMLDGAESLSLDQRAVIDGTRSALGRLGRDLPLHRRWAMRIDLAEYAQEGGLIADSTLLRWIAQKVSARSNMGNVTPSLLKTWMARWPWFLVLDGLDEVTEPQTRRRLIEQVTEFVDEAEADNCDTLVVLTTRPVGYTEHIAPNHFEQIDLDYLDIGEAVRYGELAVRVRLHGDVERIDRTVRRLRDAAKDEALRYLLRTPLQVLILTIIVEASGQLAPDRFSLFWNYYDTVFKRERDKAGDFSHLLREHGSQIQQLHERVGFELQVRSETAEGSTASLPFEELRELTWSVLEADGFDPAGRHADLLTRVLTAATHRLVLLAPRGTEGYGFDVRSLQELMAAMHLTNATLETVERRLRVAAANPHWRNTWIFAAGRLFSIPQAHSRQAVVNLVASIDSDAAQRLGRILPVAPDIALEIIDDGMARAFPRWRGALMEQALRVLTEPTLRDLSSVARILIRYADISPEHASEVSEGIRQALGGDALSRKTAAGLQELIPPIAAELGAGLRALALGRVLRRPSAPATGGVPDVDWNAFNEEIMTAPVTADEEALLRNAGADLVAMTRALPKGEDGVAIRDALRSAHLAKIFESAIEHVARDERVRMTLTLRTLPSAYRLPVGDALRKGDDGVGVS